MKSKTPPISKNTLPADSQVAKELAVGHSPSPSLGSLDDTLFRAFQSNLLSLISHELRTPLTGILNALGALEDSGSASEPSAISSRELIRMARQNAERLHRSLVSLLDLAAIESGTFHVRLREVDFQRLVRSRYEACLPLFKDRGVQIQWSEEVQKSQVSPLLADPKKLGQALELCFQILIQRAQPSGVQVRLLSSSVEVSCIITPEVAKIWRASWSQSLVGLQGGVSSPYSAFAGVIQSEQAFLARVEEGLGSELILIHEILRMHHGQFIADCGDLRLTLKIELPQLSSEEGLKAVLESRAYSLSTELGSVALVLIAVPEGIDSTDFREMLGQSLFRSTDAAYSLSTRNQVALVLNDCRQEDVSGLMGRLSKSLFLNFDKNPKIAMGFGFKNKNLKKSQARTLDFGAAHCPVDHLDPRMLLEIADSRLKERVLQSKVEFGPISD